MPLESVGLLCGGQPAAGMERVRAQTLALGADRVSDAHLFAKRGGDVEYEMVEEGLSDDLLHGLVSRLEQLKDHPQCIRPEDVEGNIDHIKRALLRRTATGKTRHTIKVKMIHSQNAIRAMQTKSGEEDSPTKPQAKPEPAPKTEAERAAERHAERQAEMEAWRAKRKLAQESAGQQDAEQEAAQKARQEAEDARDSAVPLSVSTSR